jgi:hypothetical protein
VGQARRSTTIVLVVVLVALAAAGVVLVAASLSDRTAGPPQADLGGRGGPVDGVPDSAVPDLPTDPEEPDVDVDVTASTEVTGPTLWLCGPEVDDDPCRGDLDATVVAADGSRTVEPAAPLDDPPVDCFYVYPTVSQASGTTAPREVTDAERDVAAAQAARFSEVCRVVAPVYRQVTVAGLLGSFRDPEQRAIGFGDVLSAFNDHVAGGDRPFVLLGHSQGAHVLTQLVAERIEGDPDLRDRLVSAILVGGEVEVPWGEDVGGSFQLTPACRAAAQTGCVVAYNAFAEEPPTGALFGRSRTDQQILCVHPAAPEGGAAPLRPYLPTRGADPAFDTPFATAEDAITAECRTAGNASWLQVDIDPDRSFQLTAGDLGRGPAWGLHTGDVNLALGDLVDLVRSQVAAHAGGAAG